MKKMSFEERLHELEVLSDALQDSSLSIEDALKKFERGMELAQTLNKDIESIESKIEKLKNRPTTQNGKTELHFDLFSLEDEDSPSEKNV